MSGAGKVAFATQSHFARNRLNDLVVKSWSDIGVGTAAVAAIKQAVALSGKSTKSQLTFLAGVVLGSFLFGAHIAQQREEEEQKIEETVWILYHAAWEEAVQRHSELYPKSKIIVPENPMSIILSDHPRYVIFYGRIRANMNNVRDQLRGEIGAWVAINKMSSAATSSWRDFIGTRFNQVSLHIQQIFKYGELM